jgi:hypothetical protein
LHHHEGASPIAENERFFTTLDLAGNQVIGALIMKL